MIGKDFSCYWLYYIFFKTDTQRLPSNFLDKRDSNEMEDKIDDEEVLKDDIIPSNILNVNENLGTKKYQPALRGSFGKYWSVAKIPNPKFPALTHPIA